MLWGFSQFPVGIGIKSAFKLVKMWLSGTPDVVVGTLKIDIHFYFYFFAKKELV